MAPFMPRVSTAKLESIHSICIREGHTPDRVYRQAVKHSAAVERGVKRKRPL